jgi:hypothetical protein
VYKIKYELNEGIDKYKACFDGESCFQNLGIGFNDTYTLVAKFEVIKAMLEL